MKQERVAWSAPVRAARVVLPFLVALLENNTVRASTHAFICVCVRAYVCDPFEAVFVLSTLFTYTQHAAHGINHIITIRANNK